MYKILIVEDDQFVCDLYTRFFSLKGCEVIAAFDGIDGLETLKSFNPDIILLDLMMPRLNGLDFLDKLYEVNAYQRIPVFVLSNISDDSKIKLCLQKGAKDYIVKSQMIPQDILNKIDTFLKTYSQI